MRKVLVTGAVVAGIALITLLGPRYGAVGQYYGAGHSRIVSPGERVTLTDSNRRFQASTALTANFFSHQNFLGNFTADASGNFSITVTIPTDATAGSHRIVVSGNRAGGGGTATVTFDVIVSAEDLPETGRTTSDDVARALAVLTIGELAIGYQLWSERRRRTQRAG